ncbi:hypothetical protein AgCh_003847 [Apium graveolens]
MEFHVINAGGVTSMGGFLKEFFPVVYKRTQQTGLESEYCSKYCKYNNQGLLLITSSLYLAALVATFFASYTTRNLGRRYPMLIARIFFIVGVILSAGALDLTMLIVGRIALGCGVGFANQAVPLYVSEMAPTRIHGVLNILFQLMVTIGILCANLVNYGTSKIEGGWGWRVSLGLAGIPALLLTLGSLLVFDTPNSLMERGKLEEGRIVLKKIRGIENVEPEFRELVEASGVAREVEHPFTHLLMTKNRPQLIIAVSLQIFQQFTGINAIMFYAPILFESLGFGCNVSLYSAVITGGVNVLSTILSIFVVDKIGRRKLLLEAGCQMFVAQILIAIVLQGNLGATKSEENPPLPAVSLVHGCRYSRGSPQILDASLSPDKEPLPDCRTSDSKLLGAKCRILQSLPTRTPVDYRDRAPKAHTRFHPTSPMRTPIDYRRRPSVQAYPWRSLTTDTAFPIDVLQEGVLQ